MRVLLKVKDGVVKLPDALSKFFVVAVEGFYCDHETEKALEKLATP